MVSSGESSMHLDLSLAYIALYIDFTLFAFDATDKFPILLLEYRCLTVTAVVKLLCF